MRPIQCTYCPQWADQGRYSAHMRAVMYLIGVAVLEIGYSSSLFALAPRGELRG